MTHIFFLKIFIFFFYDTDFLVTGEFGNRIILCFSFDLL